MAIQMTRALARYFPDERFLGLRLGMPMAEAEAIAADFGRAFKNGRQRCQIFGQDGKLIEVRTYFESIVEDDLDAFRKQIRVMLTNRFGKSAKNRSSYAAWYLDDTGARTRIWMANDATSCELVMDLAHRDTDIGCGRDTCLGDCLVLAESVA